MTIADHACPDLLRLPSRAGRVALCDRAEHPEHVGQLNFFPVTAIMIVLLALLNDGAILSIAYDNVRYKDQPEAWNMRLVLGIASVLGLVGPVAALGLFYLGDKVFTLGRPEVQTLMYLMLSVAGSLTIFLTRTRGPFGPSAPPASSSSRCSAPRRSPP